MLVEYLRESDFMLYIFSMVKSDLFWGCGFGEEYLSFPFNL